jgi:hypothetical protein
MVGIFSGLQKIESNGKLQRLSNSGKGQRYPSTLISTRFTRSRNIAEGTVPRVNKIEAMPAKLKEKTKMKLKKSPST